MSQDVLPRFGLAFGQTDVDECGDYSNQNSVQDEVRIDLARDPDSE